MHRSASGCTRQLQALQSWATLPPHVRNTSHSRCRRHRAESDSICLPCALSKKLCKLPNVHQQVSFAMILLLANIMAHRQCTDDGMAAFAQMYQCSLVHMSIQFWKLGSPSLQDIRQSAMPMCYLHLNIQHVMVQAVLQAPGKENAGASPDCHTTATVPQAKK